MRLHILDTDHSMSTA